MWSVSINVNLKKGVLDAQGAATNNALKSLGYEEVKDVRIGKCIHLKMDGETRETVSKKVDEMCNKLLANPVIENFTYEIEVL